MHGVALADDKATTGVNDCLWRGMFVDVAYWRWPTIFNPCAQKLLLLVG